MRYWIVSLFFLVLSGCSTQLIESSQIDPFTGTPKDQLPTFMSQDYRLQTFNGESIDDDLRLYIRFEPVAGSADQVKINGRMCNTFFGQGVWDPINATIHAPQLASTRMFCEKEILNALDGAIGRLFYQPAKIVVEGNSLRLESEGLILTYLREEAPADFIKANE